MSAADLARHAEIREQIKAARAECVESIKRVNADDNYSDSYRDEFAKKAQAKLADRVHELKDQGAQVQQRLTEYANGSGKRSTEQQQLDQAQEQRAWSRLERELEAGAGWQDLLAQAEKDRDPAALAALRSEAPSYVAATLRKAGKPVDLEEIRAAVHGTIDRALGVVGSGEDRDRARMRTRLEPLGVAMGLQVEAAQAEASGRPSDPLREAVGLHHAQQALGGLDGLYSGD